MLFKSLLAIALLAAPLNTPPERDWRYAGKIDGQATLFIDINSVDTGAQPYPKGRTVLIAAPGASSYAALEGLVEYDCDGHRRRGIEAAGYDEDGKVRATAGAEGRWNAQGEDSVLWNAEQVICGRTRLPERSYGSDVPIAAGRAILRGEAP